MIKAYKYRLYPTAEQATFFEKSFGCCRYVYNWALQRRIETYQNSGERLSYVSIAKELTSLKKQDETEWLSEVSNQSLQSSIRNMDAAFTRFFREKKGFPKFKSKKRNGKSFQFVQQVYVDFESKRIQMPKVGKVKFACDRTFVGKIGTCTVSKSPTNKYYISITVDDGKPIPEKPMIDFKTSVGVDVGIKDFAVLSNGQVFENPKFLEKAEKRLKVLQRRLAKKQKGSKRRERAKLAVAKQHERIRNKRTNFIHQATSKIVRENQTIVIEDLNVDGMLKNHCLAKSISSVAWSEFFRQLQYKCDWYGKNLVRIGRFEPSSKMCLCGSVYKELKLSQRRWVCPSCGRDNDRDLLAAVNILRFGLQEQNLINNNKSPYVVGVEDVEWSALADAMKRQSI
jgi:putative transposase